jgi:hypothetical protein
MGFSGNDHVRKLEANLDPFEIYDEAMIDSEPAVNLAAIRSPTPAECTARAANLRTNDRRINSVGSGMKKSIRTTIAAFFSNRLIVLLVAGLAAFSIYTSKPWSYFVQPDLVYAYFEVRAVDADGRPIAGAIVKNSGKRVGTTDSFGEWRRYMRVPLGGAVPISLTKKTNEQILFVTKNFAIPPFKPEKSEIELRSSVQLLPSKNHAIADDVNTQGVREETGDIVKQDQKSSAHSAEQFNRSPFKSVIVDSTLMGSAGENPKTSLNSFRSDHETVWFEVTNSERNGLAKEILPALVQRAREVGLRVERDAPWVIRLTGLIEKPARLAKDGGGLILVTSFNRDGSKSDAFEFLRNYQADARSTARGLLFGLINHVNKNVLLLKAGDRWAAVLPKKSASIWQLSANKNLLVGEKSVNLGADAYSDANFSGFYIQKSNISPCPESASECTAVTPSFIQVAPVANWVKLRLKHPVPAKASSSIFVAGYPAKSLGNDVFEYWGQKNGRVNVTVVENGRVVVRGSVLNAAEGLASFNGQNVTRR